MPLDVVYHTLFPWENPYSSISRSLACQLARQGHRIWYVNPPYSWRTLWQRRREPLTQKRWKVLRRGHPLEKSIPELPQVKVLQPPPILPINFLPHGKLYEYLRQYNERIAWNAVYQWLHRHGIRQFLYINCYNPYYLPTLPAAAQACCQVYQCVDDITQDPWTARHGPQLERKAISQADVVWVTSRRLYTLKKPLNPHTYLLPNAVDVDCFAQALAHPLPRPAELQALSGPFIGYTGNLDPYRIDYTLLHEVAQRHPDKQLILVGPINAQREQIAPLRALPNVHFMGPRPIEALPSWLQHFDCTLLPFACNTLTASIYPLKINEYLAAGKAVVSTAFSADICTFEPVIFLAQHPAQFVQLIDRAIAADKNPELQQQRLSIARQNSWQARVDQLFDILSRHSKCKQLWKAEN